MLQPGQKAPDFSTTDYLGNPIALRDYAGKKLMICFLRYAGCPFCNLSLLKIIEAYPKFHKDGLEILCFIQSPAEGIASGKPAQLNPPFPLIPDPEKKIYTLYGVTSSIIKSLKTLPTLPYYLKQFAQTGIRQGKVDGDLLLMPAYFLISEKGHIIHSAYFSENFGDHIPFIRIHDFLLFE